MININKSAININRSVISVNRDLNIGYSYYSVITIDHTQVFGTQTNFPVLISGTYSYLKTVANGGNVQNSNGYDIIFTSDANGTNKLNWETERYSATTGDVIYWVNVPLISSSADTTFYMFYGNSSINSDQSNTTGTWDSNYVAVYHMKNGVTLDVTNSVSGNTATNNGTTATTGKIDGGALFNGSTNSINLGDNYGITGDLTISAWINPTNFNNYNGIVGKTNGGQPNPYDFYLNQITGYPFFFRGNGLGSNDGIFGTFAPPTGSWSYINVTAGGNLSRDIKIYLSGVTAFTKTFNAGGDGANGSVNNYIGSRTDGTTRFWGTMDEVRISKIARSPEWIKTEYYNQNSPGTFYSMINYSTYSYVKTITIDYTKVSGDQTNFPVLISGNYPYLKTVSNGGNVQNNNGYDIIFASDSQGVNRLSFEQVGFTGTTGDIIYYVKIPNLSSTVNTTFYMLYGNANITTPQSNIPNTWDSGFTAVYHFGNNTTLSTNDSTNNVPLINAGGSPVTASSGVVGGAANFNGSNQYFNAGNNFAFTGDFSVCLWSYATNVVSILAKVPAGTGKANPIKLGYTAGTNKMGMYLGDGTNETVSSSNTLQPASTWTHLGFRMSGTTYTFFYNGNTDGTGTNSQSRVNDPALNTSIGSNSAAFSEWYAGNMDEFWISSTPRSNGWIKTVYNNQSSPSTFYTIT